MTEETENKTYEDCVETGGEYKNDLSVVLNPVFKHLKDAFSVVFASDGMNGLLNFQGGLSYVN